MKGEGTIGQTGRIEAIPLWLLPLHMHNSDVKGANKDWTPDNLALYVSRPFISQKVASLLLFGHK